MKPVIFLSLTMTILFSGLVQAKECSIESKNNSVLFEGHGLVEKKVQRVAERNANGDKFLFGFPETSSIVGQYKDSIAIKYTVTLMEVYSTNDKEWAGSRDVIVVLDKSNCALVGRPLDLGANLD